MTGLVYLLVVAVPSFRARIPFAWETPFGVVGLLTLIIGHILGLRFAPAEAYMGDVGRILYVHVPAAWIALICFLVAFVCAVVVLWTGKRAWDSAMESACEVGAVEGVLLLALGAIFGRPTWGVWWSWDPRLTSSAVLVLSFVGVLLLRGMVRDPERRATWSAVVTMVAAVNVPITYYSVKWWRSLHQTVSETTAGSTIDPSMRWILFFNTYALAFATVWFLAKRWRLAERRAVAEQPDPLPEVRREP